MKFGAFDAGGFQGFHASPETLQPGMVLRSEHHQVFFLDKDHPRVLDLLGNEPHYKVYRGLESVFEETRAAHFRQLVSRADAVFLFHESAAAQLFRQKSRNGNGVVVSVLVEGEAQGFVGDMGWRDRAARISKGLPVAPGDAQTIDECAANYWSGRAMSSGSQPEVLVCGKVIVGEQQPC